MRLITHVNVRFTLSNIFLKSKILNYVSKYLFQGSTVGRGGIDTSANKVTIDVALTCMMFIALPDNWQINGFKIKGTIGLGIGIIYVFDAVLIWRGGFLFKQGWMKLQPEINK